MTTRCLNSIMKDGHNNKMVQPYCCVISIDIYEAIVRHVNPLSASVALI